MADRVYEIRQTLSSLYIVYSLRKLIVHRGEQSFQEASSQSASTLLKTQIPSQMGNLMLCNYGEVDGIADSS